MVGSDPSLADLVKEIAALRGEVVKLQEQLAARDEEIGKLRAALEQSRRSGKRQAGPFSKGPPKSDPKKPGRKAGKDYGPKERRKIPEKVDEEIEAYLPSRCPDCGGGVEEDGAEPQYQTEVPKVEPVVRQFNVHFGHCVCCRRRVQGRHPQQTSDALGAAASQLGPRTVALATHFQKELGLSFGKAQRVLSQAIYRTRPKFDLLLRHREATSPRPDRAPRIDPLLPRHPRHPVLQRGSTRCCRSLIPAFRGAPRGAKQVPSDFG